jgi:uncharacterized protein DUF4304
MATAQETFRGMLRDEIAPALRALGFKGSGANYHLPSDTHWALLGFQKSDVSSAAVVRFTVNLQVVSRSVWDDERAEHPWMPEQPTATTGWGFAWWVRLGELAPHGGEIWWDLRAGSDTSVLAGAVVWAIEDFGLPAMREQLEAT